MKWDPILTQNIRGLLWMSRGLGFLLGFLISDWMYLNVALSIVMSLLFQKTPKPDAWNQTSISSSFHRDVFTLRIVCACVILYRFSRLYMFHRLLSNVVHQWRSQFHWWCRVLYLFFSPFILSLTNHNIHQPQPIIVWSRVRSNSSLPR